MNSLLTKSLFALLVVLWVVCMTGTASAAPSVGRFTRVEGTVDVLRGGTLPAVAAKAGDDIFKNDIVRTKTNSRAEILFHDKNVLKIGQRSRIDISEYPLESSGGQRVVKLQRGTVGAEVTKENTDKISTSKGAYTFEIHTTTAVAGVRGTIFYSYVGTDGVNHFSCFEGTIYVASMGVRVEVQPGYTVDVRPGLPPSQPRPLTDAEKRQLETAVAERHQQTVTPAEGTSSPQFVTETPAGQTDIVVPPPVTETQPAIETVLLTGSGGGATTPATKPITYTTAGQAGIFSLYIDSLGNAGIMVNGSPVQIEPASVVAGAGITPANFSSYIMNVSASGLSGSGGFQPPPGSIFVGSGSAVGYVPGNVPGYGSGGAEWGTYSSAFSGDYSGAPTNTWYLSTYPGNPQTDTFLVRTENFGAAWANGSLFGKTLGYFVTFDAGGGGTGILAGDFNGSYNPLSASNGTWQGAATGVAMSTEKVITLLNSGGQTTLAQLGLPCVEVGRADFSGFAQFSTIGSVNFTVSNALFLTVQGGATKPGLWLSGNVAGSYTGNPSGGSGSLSSTQGLSGGVSVVRWNPAANQFLLSLNGSGTYTGTGTLSGSPVALSGHAAGWFSGPGTIAGTASGFFK